MKKNIGLLKVILLIFAMLAFFSCTSNLKKSWNLNGHVKSFVQKSYKVKKENGDWEKGDMYSCIKFIFHKNGLLQKIEYFNTDNELIGELRATYVKKELSEESYYDHESNLVYKTEVNYVSENDMKLKRTYVDSDKTELIELQKEKGKTIKETIGTYEDGIKTGTTKHFVCYDENDNPFSLEVRITGDVKLKEYYTYEYVEFDKKGNWTKYLSYTDNNEEPDNISTREYEYY